MDNASFAKGEVSRLQTPFLGIDTRKGVFCFDVYIVTSSHEFSRINSIYEHRNKMIPGNDGRPRVTLMRSENSPSQWTIDVARVACPPLFGQPQGLGITLWLLADHTCPRLRSGKGTALHIKCISIFIVVCFFIFFLNLF